MLRGRLHEAKGPPRGGPITIEDRTACRGFGRFPGQGCIARHDHRRRPHGMAPAFGARRTAVPVLLPGAAPRRIVARVFRWLARTGGIARSQATHGGDEGCRSPRRTAPSRVVVVLARSAVAANGGRSGPPRGRATARAGDRVPSPNHGEAGPGWYSGTAASNVLVQATPGPSAMSRPCRRGLSLKTTSCENGSAQPSGPPRLLRWRRGWILALAPARCKVRCVAPPRLHHRRTRSVPAVRSPWWPSNGRDWSL